MKFGSIIFSCRHVRALTDAPWAKDITNGDYNIFLRMGKQIRQTARICINFFQITDKNFRNL